MSSHEASPMLPDIEPGRHDRTIAIAALGVGLVLTALALFVKTSAAGGEGHAHGHAEGGEEHEEGARVELDDDQIERAGIGLGTSGADPIVGVLRVRGQISLNRDAVTELAPRFGGTVESLSKGLGDRVRRGESVARVESSATRAQIDLRSGIDGVVTSIRAGRGSYASSAEPLVVIADLSKVWAEFRVPERDAAALEPGDPVKMKESLGAHATTGTIGFISPTVDEDTQSVVVRAVLANDDGTWRPGTFIEAEIETGTTNAAVAVTRNALHDMDGKTVVFVREAEHFEPRAVSIGAVGRDLAEVTSGLKAGETYASTNSYVVKAELLKSSAAHEH